MQDKRSVDSILSISCTSGEACLMNLNDIFFKWGPKCLLKCFKYTNEFHKSLKLFPYVRPLRWRLAKNENYGKYWIKYSSCSDRWKILKGKRMCWFLTIEFLSTEICATNYVTYHKFYKSRATRKKTLLKEQSRSFFFFLFFPLCKTKTINIYIFVSEFIQIIYRNV